MKHILKLYVSHETPLATRALANLNAACGDNGGADFDLEVVNVLENPQRAAQAGVWATPVLVKEEPAPEQWMLGDLSDRKRLERVLGFERSSQSGRKSLRLLRGMGKATGKAVREQGNGELPVVNDTPRVLVIDDFEGVHLSFAMALDEAPVTLLFADTGERGLELVRTQNVALVYLDASLPGIDGIETLRRLREIEPNVPVYVMTAFDHGLLDRRLLEASRPTGPVLTKPLELAAIYDITASATRAFEPIGAR